MAGRSLAHDYRALWKGSIAQQFRMVIAIGLVCCSLALFFSEDIVQWSSTDKPLSVRYVWAAEEKSTEGDVSYGDNRFPFLRPLLPMFYNAMSNFASSNKAESNSENSVRSSESEVGGDDHRSSESEVGGDDHREGAALKEVVSNAVAAMADSSEEYDGNHAAFWKFIRGAFRESSNESESDSNDISIRERRLIPALHETPLPALPLKLSLGTWIPDWSVLSAETAEEIPTLLYYVTMIFMQESVIFNKQEMYTPLPRPTTPPQTETDTLMDISVITDPGIGNPTNRYAFTITPFKGKVYVGTLNFKSREGLDLFFAGLPFISEGAEIWEGAQPGGAGTEWTWRNVVKNGLGSHTNGGVRKMLAYGEFIFAVTLNHFLGFELWKSRDGTNWVADVRLGLGNRFNTSGRGLEVYKGYLYVGVENRATGAQLWRRKVAPDGEWEEGSKWQAIAHGTGKGGVLTNFWFSDFAKFQDCLYVGTMNFLGLEIWRVIDTEGAAPEDVIFEQTYKGDVRDQGRGVSQLYVWGDKLLAGTMFRRPGGAVLLSSIDGENFETHFPPTTVGEGAVGEKEFLYLWSMIEYNGRMYIGANEWTAEKQGFVLFSLDNLEDPWTVETATAFGYAPLYYGIRSMADFNGQLLMGTASSEPLVLFSAVAKITE